MEEEVFKRNQGGQGFSNRDEDRYSNRDEGDLVGIIEEVEMEDFLEEEM